MRPEFAIPIALAFTAAAVGVVFLVTLGGVLTKSEHEWRIEIEQKAPGPWTVSVPRLVPTANATSEANESLSRLLEAIIVETGDAKLQLATDSLRIVGTESAVVVASRTLPRGVDDFLEWMPTGRVVSRVDDGGAGPTIRVTWSVDFTAGGGHACRASAKHAVDVPPGEERAFPEPITAALVEPEEEGEAEAPERPLWLTVCS